MKKLFNWADDCIRQWDWKNVALLKFCMLALGVLLGLALPRCARSRARAVSGMVFLLTWVPLMASLLNAAPWWEDVLPDAGHDSAE